MMECCRAMERGVAPRLRVGAALLVTWIVFGSTFLAIKVALQSVPPLLTAGINLLGAGTALLAWQWPRGERLGWAQWRPALVQGTLLFFLGRGFLVWGTQHLSSQGAALLSAATPLWVALLGAVAFRQRLTPRAFLGVITGFVGMVILIAPASGGQRLSLVGVGIMTVSSVSWAVGSLSSRAVPQTTRPLTATAMQMLAGGAILTVASGAIGEWGRLHGVSVPSLMAVAYLTLAVALVGFTTFAWLLRVTSAALANTFAFVSPLVAMALSRAILNEPLAGRTLAAAAVIVLGLALMAAGTEVPVRADGGETRESTQWESTQ